VNNIVLVEARWLVGFLLSRILQLKKTNKWTS